MSGRETIVLVRPPTVMPHSAVNTVVGTPPLGIAYLAGSLAAAGHGVVVIDGFGLAMDRFSSFGRGLFVNGLTASEIVERIPAGPALIGVSCMFSNEWAYARVVIEAIAARFPGVPVVVGGEHATADAESVLASCPAVACCVLGEGEEALVELASALPAGKSLSDVDGLAFRGGDGRVVRSRPRTRIRAIDRIPWPSWDGIPMDAYLDNGLGHDVIRSRNMPMLASRGCPYRCTFCSSPGMWGTLWVAREPAEVVREIKHYLSRFRADHIEFYDLTTIVKRSWIIEFCDRLIAEKLPVTWALPSGTRSEALDEEVLVRLSRSGCRALTYAPESGSPATLARIKKKVEPGKMLRSMRAAVRHGITVRANIIMGLPGQTKREALESLLFVFRMAWLGVNDVAVFPFVPYPGSELFDQLEGRGAVVRGSVGYEEFLSGNIYNEVGGIRSWSEHLSPREVRCLCVGGMGAFYALQFLLRPHRIVLALINVAKARPKTMFDRTILALTRNFLLGVRRRRSAERPRRTTAASGTGD